jgi:signal transduction histidine kinase
LIGHIEVALRNERDASEYRDVLLRTHKKALQLGRIVESLLFLSRSEAEAVQPQSESLNLAAWLAENMHRWSHHERHSDLRMELRARNYCAIAPPELLSQICDILVDNALKYGDPGTPIVIALTDVNGDLQLHVTNHGISIPSAEVQQLFRPFFRSSEVRRRGIDGVGLGLSIARRLAESFGGSITVRSGQGNQTSFIVTFRQSKNPVDSYLPT